MKIRVGLFIQILFICFLLGMLTSHFITTKLVVVPLETTIAEQEERIENQSYLSSALAAEIQYSHSLLMTTEKLKESFKQVTENMEQLVALQPLYDVLPLDDILNLIKEIPQTNLFNADWQVTANFGESVGFHGRLRSVHEGIDMISEGGVIQPFAGGEVVDIGINEIYGKHLTIQHSPHLRSFYAHAETIFWAADLGQIVTLDTKILRVGNTGQVYSSVGNDGTHLHFELQIKVGETWVPINPRPFLTKEVKE